MGTLLSPESEVKLLSELVMEPAALTNSFVTEVLESLTRLSQMDDELSTSQRSDGLRACIANMLQFIKAIVSGELVDGQDVQYVRCVALIMSPRLLTTMLHLRDQILGSAFSEDEVGDDDQVLISCTDIFFVYFADMVTVVAGSRSKAKQTEYLLSNTLQMQMKAEALRLACQLPRNLANLPSILRSQHASPAVKRLALTIMYALLVLRPDLEECDPWSETSIDPHEVHECTAAFLDELLEQARSMQLSGAEAAGCNLRIAYAMLIAIYAQADYAAEKDRERKDQPSFRPFTLASLLELMSFVITPHDSDANTLLEELDESQAALLYWGCTLPWVWEKWDDPRVLQFETVVKLTSNWIYHLDIHGSDVTCNGMQQMEECEVLRSDKLTQTLQRAVHLNPGASMVALSHQLMWAKNALELNSPLLPEAIMATLHRVVSLLAGLITFTQWNSASTNLRHVATQLIDLFLFLVSSVLASGDAMAMSFWDLTSAGMTSRRIARQILRTLRAFDDLITEKSLVSLKSDAKSVGKAAIAIRLASRLSSKRPDQGLTAPESSCLAAILDFLALILHSGATQCLPLDSTSALLSDATFLISTSHSSADLRTTHLNCLVAAYSRCRSPKSPTSSDEQNATVKLTRLWKDEDAYNLALNVIGTDPDLAAFASYVSLTTRKSANALLVLETWDYLRDVLIILATGRLYVDRFPKKTANELASVAEKICKSLELLLSRCDKRLARFLLQSPMTLSLTDVLSKPVEPLAYACMNRRDEGVSDEQPSRFSNICAEFLRKLRDIESNLKKKERQG